MTKGQVYKIHSDFYYVEADNVSHECKLREVLKKQGQKVLVGDFVEINNGHIEKVLPRKNFIKRPSVANIDTVIVVSAIKEPELDFTQLNRYISFAKYFNLDTKLCFNKNDLSSDDSIIEKIFGIYEPLGYDIIFTSAIERIGLEDFKEILENKISVLCGNSGVGKTTLINALNPNLKLKTGEISEKTHRGTHTTRHSEIIKITDNIKIIDTPGFSNLKFDFLLPNEIDRLFPEIHQYSHDCKYPDCLHINEDNCSVLENIENINISRYESYTEFVKEASEYKKQIKFNGQKTETQLKQQHNKDFVKINRNKRQEARNTLKQKLNKGNDYEELY
ncbi:ribosome small subunit-dependent GTPase A [bacterium]|nr:ribosome small subunit-dependent GTPase A [bacterium]